MKHFATALILSAICIGVANADSDGYFCSSPEFLAYEFSFSKEPTDQHKLYIFFFGTEQKGEHQWLQIPIFQVHSIKCSPDRVEIIGWEKYFVYSVSPNGVTPLAEEKLPAPRKLPEGFVPTKENLGGFSPVTRGDIPSTYTYALTTTRPNGNYEIRLQRKQTGKPCRPVVESNLVKVSQENRVTATWNLYTGAVSIECGE